MNAASRNKIYRKPRGTFRRRTPPLVLIFFTAFSFLCVYPMWFVLVTSLNDPIDAALGHIFFWPRQFSVLNYQVVFQNRNLLQGFVISISRGAIMTFLVPLINSMYAYALSHTPLIGRKFFSRILVAPMYIGGGLIPFFFILRALRLYDTFWVYIVPYMFSIYNVLLFRSYFQDLTSSLRDSAVIDGANEWVVFTRVVFPISIPVFAAVALFTAVGQWNEWMIGQLFTMRGELTPLPTILMQILKNQDMSSTGVNTRNIVEATVKRVTPESVRLAMVVIVTLPVLAVYPLLQKYFIHGIMIGAVKE